MARTLSLGPAGCGKTTAALATAERYVDTSLRSHQRVLMLSFSRAAVHRMWSALSRSKSRDLRTRVRIDTYAGIQWDLLQRFGRYLGKGRAPALVSEFERAPGLPVDAHSATFREAAALSLDLLRSSPSLLEATRDRYPVVIVDEFQDTRDPEWALIEILSGGNDLHCFADPEQGIYQDPDAVAARLDTARAAGCQEVVLAPSSRRDRTGGSLVGLAVAVRDQAGLGAAVRQAGSAIRLIPPYAYPTQFGSVAVAEVRRLRRDHPQASIGVLTLNAARVADLAAAFQRAGRNVRVLGLDHVRMAMDPLVLGMWSRCCGAPLRDLEICRRLGVALSALRIDGEAAGYINGVILGTTSKRCLEIIEALGKQRMRPDPAKFASVDRALGLVSSKTFKTYARFRSAALRADVEEILDAQPALATADVITRVMSNLVAEVAAEKYRGGGRLQLMSIHAAKGREFDRVVIANYPNDQLHGPTAAHLLYTGLTRARDGISVITPREGPDPRLRALCATRP